MADLTAAVKIQAFFPSMGSCGWAVIFYLLACSQPRPNSICSIRDARYWSCKHTPIRSVSNIFGCDFKVDLLIVRLCIYERHRADLLPSVCHWPFVNPVDRRGFVGVRGLIGDHIIPILVLV